MTCQNKVYKRSGQRFLSFYLEFQLSSHFFSRIQQSAFQALLGIFICLLFNVNNQAVAGIAFGSTYEITDAATKNCGFGNVLANGTCACPGYGPAVGSLRLIGDFGGSIGGANIQLCSNGLPAGSSDFGGVFLIDDNNVCRTANAITNACICPSGYVAQSMRTLLDAGNPFIGARINFCNRVNANSTSFRGAYQLDDTNKCLTSNPDTNACSCPAGSRTQLTRSVVQTSGGLGGTTVFTCLPPSVMTQICVVGGQAVVADITGAVSASAAIQSCIDNTAAGGTLDLAPGNYLITTQIKIKKSIKLHTQGTYGSSAKCLSSIACATLVAAKDFGEKQGILEFGFDNLAVKDVEIDHIVLDGNRTVRKTSTVSPAFTRCKAGLNDDNSYGYNANAVGDNLKLTYSVSINALCGTGFGYVGSGATISQNLFANNGGHDSGDTWADGLTVGWAHNSSITNNVFTDNTDVGFIYGGGKGSVVQNNFINQTNAYAFAAMMLNSFGARSATNPNFGIFTGTVISNNTITCQPGKCFFGLNVGDHAWQDKDFTPNLIDISLTSNKVTGGAIGLNIDGASNVALSGNNWGTGTNVPGTRCSPNPAVTTTVTGARFSLGPDASLKVPTDTAPNVIQTVHGCIGN